MRKSRSEWARIVARWRTSGLTAVAFAEGEGLNANTLRWWACTLSAPERPPAFVEVRWPSPSVPGPIEVVIRGVVVRVPGDFDAAALRRVLTVLEER